MIAEGWERAGQCTVATVLREAGYLARRLEDGFPEWKADSRPVDTGTQSAST